MKLTNLCILFVILEIAVIVSLDSRMNHLIAIGEKTIEYNKALDSAVDDGTMDLVEIDNNRNVILNKEKATEQFLISLYANFGVTGDGIIQKKLREHIPIILVTDIDGFYINYMDTYEISGNIVIGSRWSEKYPYTYEDDAFIYKFTLENMVTLYNRTTNEIITGHYKELGQVYSESVLGKDDTFDAIRRTAIINQLEKWMNYYINRYNSIGYELGFTYQFWLPRVDKADWYRTIDDISMFVIFQNYPYYTASLDTYNRYSFGGARLSKSNQYYLAELNGLKYYHKQNCDYVNINGQGIAYYSKEEGALLGAFPCPHCKP